MRKLAIASIAVLGFTGAALAQEAPIFYGDVSPSVENSLPNNEVNNGTASPVPDLGLDFMPTASVDNSRSDSQITLEDTMIGSRDPNLQGR